MINMRYMAKVIIFHDFLGLLPMSALTSVSEQGLLAKPEAFSPSDETLIVADMGLDFRSYYSAKRSEKKALTNLAVFEIQKLVSSFEVTAGILFHCLRQCWKATFPEAKQWWLSTCSQFLMEHLEMRPTDEIVARTIDFICTVDFSQGNPDHYIQELCTRFDMQFPPKNSEATWDRIRKNSVQAAFCNIHTGGRKCDAKYCNQLHLRNIGEETNHRYNFYKGLIELLESEGATDEDIHYRLTDAMFFARHGNECTVRSEGRNIAFFDTTFTYGRLMHAARRGGEECRNPMCKSEQCRGIHVRKGAGTGLKERRELIIHRANEVIEGLKNDATRMMQLVRGQRPTLSRRGSESQEFSRSSSTHSSITSTMNRYNAENQVEDDELYPIPLYT